MLLNNYLQRIAGYPAMLSRNFFFHILAIFLFSTMIRYTGFANPMLQRNDYRAFQKASELTHLHQQRGFVVYKKGTIQTRINEEFPLFIQLEAGRWYHFVLVSDPRVKKFIMRLGIPGIGNLITDKFKPEQGDSFWTEFSFVCPQSGNYLLTFFQKSQETFPVHITILQRPRIQQGQTVAYRME